MSAPARPGEEPNMERAFERLREIVGPAYQKKHGRPLTWQRGWVWEMIHFIHHQQTQHQAFENAVVEMMDSLPPEVQDKTKEIRVLTLKGLT